MIYQYLFWGLVASNLIGVYLLFLRGWEGRHDKTEDSYEPFKFALLTVFAIPYLIFFILAGLWYGLLDAWENRRWANK